MNEIAALIAWVGIGKEEDSDWKNMDLISAQFCIWILTLTLILEN